MSVPSLIIQLARQSPAHTSMILLRGLVGNVVRQVFKQHILKHYALTKWLHKLFFLYSDAALPQELVRQNADGRISRVQAAHWT